MIPLRVVETESIATPLFGPPAPDSRPALKAEFLECLGRIQQGRAGLKAVVARALAAGVHWRQLIAWADGARHNDKYARKILGEALRELGIRRRKRGAGQRTPWQSLKILEDVEKEHGEFAEKFLHGAWRAARNKRLERQKTCLSPANLMPPRTVRLNHEVFRAAKGKRLAREEQAEARSDENPAPTPKIATVSSLSHNGFSSAREPANVNGSTPSPAAVLAEGL